MPLPWPEPHWKCLGWRCSWRRYIPPTWRSWRLRSRSCGFSGWTILSTWRNWWSPCRTGSRRSLLEMEMPPATRNECVYVCEIYVNRCIFWKKRKNFFFSVLFHFFRSTGTELWLRLYNTLHLPTLFLGYLSLTKILPTAWIFFIDRRLSLANDVFVNNVEFFHP